jgi:hypothetical protein
LTRLNGKIQNWRRSGWIVPQATRIRPGGTRRRSSGNQVPRQQPGRRGSSFCGWWWLDCLLGGRFVRRKGERLTSRTSTNERSSATEGYIAASLPPKTTIITLGEVHEGATKEVTYERAYLLEADDDKYAQWGNCTKQPCILRPFHPHSRRLRCSTVPPSHIRLIQHLRISLQLPACTQHPSLWHDQAHHLSSSSGIRQYQRACWVMQGRLPWQCPEVLLEG